MIMLYLLSILILYILTKLILYFIVRKYGKFSYDGFSAAGFAYNAEKDIFYSTQNAWQKNLGYTHIYDVLAPIVRMIIDTEPVRFYYNNKNWLITFWKGQYGIVTGAEVGIYCTNQEKVNQKTVYLPVDESEMLDMHLVLYKKEEIVAQIRAKHWWLAIFKLGMFSWPKELSMDVSITFPNFEMLRSFLESFKKLGYTSKDFWIMNNTFNFKYTKPRTRKVWTRTWLADKIRQFLNRKNVALYNVYTDNLIENNKIDDSRTNHNKKFIMINELLPDLLKNNPGNEERSQQIIEKIFSDKEENIVFLDGNIYSESGVNRNE